MSRSAEIQLFKGNRVVFVDNRNAVHRKQRLECRFRVGTAHRRINDILGHQNLCNRMTEAGKLLGVHPHQLRLTDRRRRLLLLRRARMMSQTEHRRTGGNSTGGHKHDLPPRIAQIGQHGNKPLEAAQMNQSRPIGQGGGADFDNNAVGIMSLMNHGGTSFLYRQHKHENHLKIFRKKAFHTVQNVV